MFVKHCITDGVLFHEWCQQIDYESNLPLLAVVCDQIVADATLHQRMGAWADGRMGGWADGRIETTRRPPRILPMAHVDHHRAG